MIEAFESKYLKGLITEDEIREARKDLFTGLSLNVYNYLTNHVEHANVDTWYANVIMFDNGCSYTMKEYVAYKRNPNKPIGLHWSKPMNRDTTYEEDLRNLRPQ